MITSYRLGFDDIVIIGVFRELLDIPAFALLGTFFILSAISFIKQKLKLTGYPFYSILILLITITGLVFLV
jgi:cytochrome c oxidase subunit IV